jgi:uncharacterized membrane protein
MRLLEFKRFCREHEAWLWASLIVVPLAVIAVGCLVWPSLFWDLYVWPHLAGSLVADARGKAVDGITEGYTLPGTLTYAYFLAVAVFGIWRLFQRLDVRLDAGFLAALVPWVVLGAEARALEDAGLFATGGPIVYMFISPLIYIFEGVLVVALVVLLGRPLRDRQDPRGRPVLLRTGSILVTITVTALGVVAIAFASAAAIALVWWWARSGRSLGLNAQLLIVGCVLAATAAAFVGAWVMDPWAVSERPVRGTEVGVILTIALGCATATYGLYWALSTRWPRARAFISSVATLLFLSHYIDGAATFRGLDALGYGEKHVLPSLLIDLTGTAAVMLVLKFLVVTAVVYLLDVAYREDMQRTPTLAWLVRVAVMVLGLAPGVRDMLRIAMGV